MKRNTALVVTVGVLLAPVLASAQSEFRACMEAQQRLSAPMINAADHRSYAAAVSASWDAGMAYYYYYSDSYSSYAFTGFGYGVGTALSSSSAWREADRVSAMVRNCRHLRKSNPPKFRILTIKSHSQRSVVRGRP